MVTVEGIEDLRSRVGDEVGVSDWVTIDQAAVDAFAEVTGDHQWIHVDPERAKDTPFGGTIVHGYFTLALAPRFTYALFELKGVAMMVNYGLNKVRFPAPTPVGSRVRMRMALTAVDDIPGGVQITSGLTFEREGGDKPVCVAESLARAYLG